MKRPPAFWVIAATLGVIACALLWGGSELHYRSCIDAAVARTGPPPQTLDEVTEQNLGILHGESRAAAVEGCSHLPF